MKVASRSGFFVFLGGILAARNVVHVRAAFTLEAPPPVSSICTDLAPIAVSSSAVLAPEQHVGDLLVPQLHLGEVLAPQLSLGELLAPEVQLGEVMSPRVRMQGFMSWLPMGK